MRLVVVMRPVQWAACRRLTLCVFNDDTVVQPRCVSTVPSCQPDGPSAIDTFAAVTSAYIKSLDRWVGGWVGGLGCRGAG